MTRSSFSKMCGNSPHGRGSGGVVRMSPRPVVAGMGIGFGPGQIYVLGGDDGSLFFKTMS